MASGATLSDVAREAGVSLATASRAINGSATRTVRPELRERVLAAAERLRYIPDANAQAMARGLTTSVGLVVHDVADPYFATIAAGVTAAADRAGCQVMLTSTQLDAEREVALVRLLQRQRARAIVLAGARLGEGPALDELRGILDDYRAAGGLVAAVGASPLDVPTVPVANDRGAADLARELHRLGYRRPAVLAGTPGHATARVRGEAFRATFAELGSPVGDEAVFVAAVTHEGGEQAMRTYLGSGVPADVVFAVADVMALGALVVARERGLRVPGDVAVAGFDGIPTLRDVTPGLTTVELPLREIGESALELALAGAAAGTPAEVPARVALRESTPPVAAD